MRIAFYGFDLGPAKNLMMVASRAINEGNRVFFIGNDYAIDPRTFMDGFDVLITGLSSYNFGCELSLGNRAVEMGIPWIVLADTHYSWS